MTSNIDVILYFNSQPHEEADRTGHAVCRVLVISTHSLTRRLTRSPRETAGRKINFNSQPHEEADGRGHGKAYWYQHFNSQPHEEADTAE